MCVNSYHSASTQSTRNRPKGLGWSVSANKKRSGTGVRAMAGLPNRLRSDNQRWPQETAYPRSGSPNRVVWFDPCQLSSGNQLDCGNCRADELPRAGFAVASSGSEDGQHPVQRYYFGSCSRSLYRGQCRISHRKRNYSLSVARAAAGIHGFAGQHWILCLRGNDGCV
jgi:hypothetical protein